MSASTPVLHLHAATPTPFRTLAELWRDPTVQAPVEWVVRDLLPADGLTMLYGIGKSGKTTLAAQLALCASRGQPFLDRITPQRDVWWLNLERSARLMFARFHAVGSTAQDTQLATFTGAWPRDPVAVLARQLDTVSPPYPLVVIDSLAPFLQLDDENSNSEITQKLSPLANLAHDRGVPILTIFHDRKSEGSKGRAIRGGSAFLAVVDAALHLRYDRDASDRDARRLETVGNYDELPPLLRLRYANGGYCVGSSLDEVLEKVRAALPAPSAAGLTVSELADRTRLKRKTVERKLDALLGRSQAEQVAGSYPARYRQ